MHPLHRLSHLLTDLPALVPDAAPADFGTAALERLAGAIDADSGVWASGALTAAGPDFHTVSLWRQPPALLADYEPLKPHDPLFQRVAAHPGRAFSASAVDAPIVFATYCARYGLAQALSAVVVHPLSGLLNGLSLWRASPTHAFTADDEAMLEAALPHLVAHAEDRLLRAVSGRTFARTVARGCADLRGRLHAATPRFLALLATEWPDWRGPDLPPAVVAAFTAALSGRPRAEATLFGAVALRITHAAPYVRLDARARQPWDALRPRERTIATLAADGQSHKEIAQTLGVAPATVRNHLARVYDTLGVHNRAQLLAACAAGAFDEDAPLSR
ncbi:MAG: LuxR C-terminal-related transcriptional regulator [Gemmatimonadetes bacterium]|nr:LuxR C-terminal-related transcriptional regulator [Gemmatimonadota bacterium]